MLVLLLLLPLLLPPPRDTFLCFFFLPFQGGSIKRAQAPAKPGFLKKKLY